MSDANISSERPKRDAAKKFLNGGDGKGADKKTEMNLRQHLPRKGPSGGKDGKRSEGGGKGGEMEKKKRLLENLPKIAVDKGIRRLDLTALKKYKRHFGLKTAPTSSNKEDLQAAVIRHFASTLRAEQGKTERSFIKAVREQKASENK